MHSIFSALGNASGPTWLGWVVLGVVAIALGGTALAPLIVVMLIAAIWFNVLAADKAKGAP